jgi:hypothetical protein
VRRLRHEERGGILVLSAFMIAVFLLLTALVVDVGNWYTHKRQLQNKADAGALAAGYEYLSQLKNCQTTPVATGTSIGDIAKRYAGTGDAAVTGAKFNQTINATGNLTVKINASDPTAADWSDGASPCGEHASGDAYSPSGAVWTDVKVRETNVGTLFGGFGLNLLSATAQARVELKQIIGIGQGGLPFIAETGDQIECVWAQFVRARDGSTTGFTVTPSNPIELTGGPYTWTGNVTNLRFTNAQDDVAIRYWGGSRDGSSPCNFSTPNKKPLPHAVNQDNNPVGVDWINVYDTGAAPGANAAPKLRRFALVSNTCGGPGFLYTASTAANTQCLLGFQAEIDTGPNRVRGEITVNPIGTGVDPVTFPFDNTGAALTTVNGTIVIFPNELSGSATYTQDYTQVGPTYFSVSWRQTTGRVGTGGQGNCANNGNNCQGTFQGETAGGSSFVQQMTYVSDPVGSYPMVGSSTSLPTTSFPAGGQTGAFTVSFSHTAIDKDHVVLIRDSGSFGPGTGNRTRSIWCGNGPGGGAAALANGIRDGCENDLVVNQRGDVCSPAPTTATNPWDCVKLEQGQKSSVAKALEDRFACTTNRWVDGGALPPDWDQRWAYIILTGFGRTAGGANNDWLPVEGLLRVYVTGWDKQGGGGGPANCVHNDDPPRGYDTQGAQLWGHFVSPITLNPDVIIGDDICNLSLQNLQCKPGLVR